MSEDFRKHYIIKGALSVEDAKNLESVALNLRAHWEHKISKLRNILRKLSKFYISKCKTT